MKPFWRGFMDHRVMQQRISIITLGVADLKKAKAFYDALGWKVASDETLEEIVAYDLQSMALALYPWEKLALDAQVPVERSGYSSFSIAHNLNSEEEVSELLSKIPDAGGTILKPATKAFWGGFSGCFADPDGHIWEIAYNPFAKLGPNGEFQWNGVST
jgi:predicted lactoylglutathione lyase